MKELIKITEQNGNQAVSARELHTFLESKQDFSNWIKNRINKYGLVDNQDYEVFNNFIENPNGGRPLTEYALTLDCAKELAMVEGNAKGKEARKYFIACEKKLKEIAKPMTTLELMKYSIDKLIEHDQRIDHIEGKVDLLYQKQQEAETELKALPVSTDVIQELSLRDKIRLLVNRYCSATGAFQQTVWDNVYQTLYYNYHIALKNCKKIAKNESWLDVAERKGYLDQIFTIVSNLLREKGMSA